MSDTVSPAVHAVGFQEGQEVVLYVPDEGEESGRKEYVRYTVRHMRWGPVDDADEPFAYTKEQSDALFAGTMKPFRHSLTVRFVQQRTKL